MKKSFSQRFNLSLFVFIWHGFFLSLTMSMIDFNTVFPALITELTDNKIIFGVLYSILLGAPLFFNAIFGYFMQYYQYKRKFLMLGIYLRSISFLGMALFTYYFAQRSPLIVIISLFFWIFLFSISGGFAGLAYTDIIGKIFKKEERGKVYTYKQFFGSIAALLGGLIIAKIFSPGYIEYPLNYTLSFSIGSAGLFIAALAFWFIKEPQAKVTNQQKEPLKTFIKKIPVLLKKDEHFLHFIIVENLSSFSLMILPFYIVFAKDIFLISESYVGRYLLFQIIGTIFSNIFWGYIFKKYSSKTVVSTCIFLGAIIPIVAIVLSFFGPNLYSTVFFLVGFVISGRRVGFDPYFLEIAPEEERSIYLGVRGTLNFMTVIMPTIGGLFIQTMGYYTTFIIVTTVMLTDLYLIKHKMVS
ncbi:MFS transporter [Petrotoga sp. DB-2]